MVRKAKSDYYLSSFSKSQGNAAHFWKVVKSLKARPASSLPSQINSENGVILNKSDICNVFNDHFILSGHLFDEQSVNLGSSDSEASVNNPINPSPPGFSFSPITHMEVHKSLLQICTKKSKGADDLSPYLLQLSAGIIAVPLAHIFNLSLTSGTIPEIWKNAQVIPLHKGGSQADLNNYRPISKLCCLAKILESLVSFQLRAFLNIHNLLQPQQSGFRPGHSTVTATTLVTNNILDGLDNHRHFAAIFIDLSKAFDTVDHQILIQKLSSIGLDELSVRWFSNYLSGRTQAVVADGFKSSALSINKGVPQGSILGPLLFTIYVNNIAVPSLNCDVHFYADDTILYSSGTSIETATANLQNAFNRFQLSLIRLKLVLNSSKTKCMVLTRSVDTNAFTGIFTLKGEQIEQVRSYKYLGIWLDDKLSFKDHVEHLTKKLRGQIGFLYRNRSCFSLASRKTIVQSVVMSVFDYGDVLYMHASLSTLKPLDAVYHSALRLITGDSYLTHHCLLYEKVGWTSLAARREQHCILFIYKAACGKLPMYLSSLLELKVTGHSTRAQAHIRFSCPHMNSEQGKTAFKYYAPDKWDKLQNSLKMARLPSIETFKVLLEGTLNSDCTCFV